MCFAVLCLAAIVAIFGIEFWQLFGGRLRRYMRKMDDENKTSSSKPDSQDVPSSAEDAPQSLSAIMSSFVEGSWLLRTHIEAGSQTNDEMLSERRKRKPPTKLPYEMDKMIKVQDFSRPAPTKEDMVVVMKNGHAKIGYVVKTDHSLRSNPMYAGLLEGTLLTIELIPSAQHVKRCIEEAVVIDRGFSLGETVVRFENEHENDPGKSIARSTRHGQIGQVIAARLVGDILALPEKNVVATNVDLAKTDQLELANFNSAHNYIVYQQWIGDIQDVVNEVSLIYNGHRFVVKDTGNDHGVYLGRKDRSDEGKGIVPGEVVQIPVSDALGKNARWAREPPFRLRKSARFSGQNDCIQCVVEKVDPLSLSMRWVTSPSAVEKPPAELPREEFHKICRVDLSANSRVASSDRIKVKPGEDDKVSSLADYQNWLDEQFKGMFEEKKKARDNGKSKVPSVRGRRRVKSCGDASSSKTSEAPPEKNARLGLVAAEEPNSSCKMETIPEHDEPLGEDDMRSSGSESEREDQDYQDDAADGHPSDRGTRKLHRSRVKRGRPKRSRRLVSRVAPPKLTSNKAKEVLGEEYVGEVLFPRTVVDVEWMDGSISYDVPGYTLVPVDPDLDQQDHLPGVLVAKKHEEGSLDMEMGIILLTDQVERSAQIRWFSLDGDKEPEVTTTEECTLFDIMPHPTYTRMAVGTLGLGIGKESQDLRDIVFQVKAHLKDGKQSVEFLNGDKSELWPTQMTPLFVAEDEDESGSEYDSTQSPSSSEDEEEPVRQPTPDPMDAVDAVLGILLKDATSNPNRRPHSDPYEESLHETPFTSVAFSEEYLKEFAISKPSVSDMFDRAKISSILLGDLHTNVITLIDSKEIQAHPDGSDAVSYVKIFNEFASLPDQFAEATFNDVEPFLSGSSKSVTIPFSSVKHIKDGMDEGKREVTRIQKKHPDWFRVLLKWAHPLSRENLEQVLASLFIELSNPGKEDEPRSADASGSKTGVQEDEEMEEEGEVSEKEETETGGECPESAQDKGTFTSLPTCPAHNWLHSGGDAHVQVRSWMRRVAVEHKMLREHLPSGIHVVAFEDRMDLLNAVVIGPRGTPFEATPFFFDIRFKSDYPASPPEVFYVAFSQEQLNPNLYQNGKVCVSLLGTWQGKGIETWSPSSNLLQVLISIQGLILVPEPYFNEAGYESRKDAPGMIEHSKRYNETATINSLHYLLKIFESAPAGMAQKIRGLIREGFPSLRASVQDWLSGRALPAYPVNMSKGFKMALEKMVARIGHAIGMEERKETPEEETTDGKEGGSGDGESLEGPSEQV